MIRPETIRAVVERIHDPAAQDRELAALHREGMLEGDSRLEDALRAIHRIAVETLLGKRYPKDSEPCAIALLHIMHAVADALPGDEPLYP